MSLFAELKRRNVIRVGIAYGVLGWVVLQGADFLLDLVGAPDWVIRVFAIAGLVGLPFALFFAWAFEVTPEGIKRTHEVDEAQSTTAQTGRRLDLLILILLLALIGLTFWMQGTRQDPPTSAPSLNTSAEPTTVTQAGPDIVANGIAVLPFVNMSDDPSQVYFADGLSEELLNNLAKVNGLHVASRTSSFAYRDSPLRLPEIADELGVAFILEGSVRKANDQVRITAQLIDTHADRHLWSETYDRSLQDIFSIQSEIANAIAAALREPLRLESGPIEVVELTQNTDAYALYLEGRSAFVGRAYKDDLERAVAALEQVVQLDPEFSRAWEYLAASYATAAYWGADEYTFEEYMNKARAAIEKALELQPDSAFAYAARGFIAPVLEPGWMHGGLQDLDLALSLDPSQPDFLNWRGQLLFYAGNFEQSLADQQRCLEIEPDYPNCLSWKVWADVLTGELEQALEEDMKRMRLRGNVTSTFEVPFMLKIYGEGTALIGSRSLPGWEDAPIGEYIDGLLGRPIDRENAALKWDAWAKRSGEEVPSEVWAALGVWDRVVFEIQGEYPWPWLDYYREFRKSDVFQQYIKDVGVYQIWQERGFPSQCQPEGEDGFSCP